MFGTFVAETHSRVSSLWLALRSAAEIDDAAHELFTRWETERRLAMLHGPVTVMIEKGVLRDGLDPGRPPICCGPSTTRHSTTAWSTGPPRGCAS